MNGDLVLSQGGFMPEKILRGHSERLAMVYIRQSNPRFRGDYEARRGLCSAC